MEFPFIWEEMAFPIPYRADCSRAEPILMECVAAHVDAIDAAGEPVRIALARRYFIDLNDLTPRVFYHLTDNRLELSVRFMAEAHGIRDVKDRIARSVLKQFDDHRIEIASATHEIVGVPTLRVQTVEPR